MKLRDLGLAISMVGFFGGQLLAAMATRAGMEMMAQAAGNASPAELALHSARATGFHVYGCAVALIGACVFVIGSVKTRNEPTP